MTTLNLITAVLGLLIVLIILVFLLVKPKDEVVKTVNKAFSNEPKKVEEVKKKREYDFEALRRVIKNKRSSTDDLAEALDLIVKYHGKIHARLGIRAHPDFDRYMDVIVALCRHPNVTSTLVVKFDRELSERNPDYVKEINDSITKGLNSRGL